MPEDLMTVDRVAELLDLHVRTVRTYIRDGKLRAVRIGKQYRISREDLEAFTGRSLAAAKPVARARHSEVSSIVEIDAVGPDTVDRISTLLIASSNSRQSGDQKLRVEVAYDETRGRMKIVVLGGISDTARLLDYIDGVLAQ